MLIGCQKEESYNIEINLTSISHIPVIVIYEARIKKIENQ